MRRVRGDVTPNVASDAHGYSHRKLYDVTHHAIDEMAEDDLSMADVEAAMLNGEITTTAEDDIRGTKYTIIGWTRDHDTQVGVVGRFKDTQVYLIITVYAIFK